MSREKTRKGSLRRDAAKNKKKNRERERKAKKGKYERKYERLVVTCAPGTGKNNEETREET